MLEKDFERKCCNLAKLNGYLVVKLANYGLGSNFLPDRMFLKEGEILLVEFKNPNSKGKLSLGQEHYFKILDKQGFKVYVIHEYDKFKELIKG